MPNCPPQKKNESPKKRIKVFTKEMIDKKLSIERYQKGLASAEERAALLHWLENDETMDCIFKDGIAHADTVLPAHVGEKVRHQIMGSESSVATESLRSAPWRYVVAVLLLVLVIGASIGGGIVMGRCMIPLYATPMVVQTGVGERSELQLPDGTEVTLNAQSRLTYDCSMPSGKRLVKLEGEGFFRVAKDGEHPFVVECEGMEVECLGTAFNMRSYADEASVSVVLSEGKVAVHANRSTLYMEPDSRVVFDKHTMSLHKQKVRSEDYTCWLKNEIRYNGETLEQIASELKRNFHVNVIITSDALKQEQYTGYLGRCSLKNILDLISITSNVTYSFEQDTTVYIYARK